MKNVVLTGFMATGKSAVGRLLASRLGYGFVDTDALIEKESGMTVSLIFEKEGESAFRSREENLVMTLARAENLVIATGGGMLLNPNNLRRLRKLGPVICLEADERVIYERARLKQGARPLLNVSDPLARIRSLLDERRRAYARADLCLDTSGLTPQEAAEKILDYLRAERDCFV